MSMKFDWKGWLKAVVKATMPFLTGALGGFLAGCSMYGSGVGVTV